MFVPYEGVNAPANAYVYRDVKVRFTYRVDIGRNQVGEMDIDGLFPGEEREWRFHQLRGPWATREEGLAAAQNWAKSWIDAQLENPASGDHK
ncbi:hypothetical protein NS337_00465 [Pseudomonas oryzihabitans]|uniref:hypothetical protein n=1 Tax=Pseudomonas oryzihabitans TaxID=47885 RepID=UPI0007370460|nr:hypothetical protein [Pseudomonas psychrotolerans]KTT57152.1 hypothetical protein NS337_00465 [Pseudomonas psychrotolerans]